MEEYKKRNESIFQKFYLKDDGIFPNNQLPAILYKNVLKLPSIFPASKIIRLFEENGWSNSWKNGIYNYNHYHSNTHEVLGIYKGKTEVLLGGENGKKVILERGDVLIIPAGVAHKNLSEENFKCVGAYPDGRDFDMNYGKSGERPMADHRILSVPLPLKDPVFGRYGDLLNFWNP